MAGEFHTKVLREAQHYCAKTERSPKHVADWFERNYPTIDPNPFVKSLTEENFLNSQRFADAFVMDKFRFNKWGRIKLKYELKGLKIPDFSIIQALERIDEKDYKSCADKLIEQKLNNLGVVSNQLQKVNKVLAYMYAKGFEQELCRELLKSKMS